MGVLICPYCSIGIPINNFTKEIHRLYFGNINKELKDSDNKYFGESCLEITFYKCTYCGEYIINAKGIGSKICDIDMSIRPISPAKKLPNYIPQGIRSDYEEAYAIVNLSPKASATLARRCLQGMIHDFWNVKLKNLNQEITALKDKIPSDLWQSINDLREMGNIGAHMEKDINTIIDIDSNEASLLIKLIELLIKEWYINREERRQLLSEISVANAAKQNKRKKNQ